MTSCICRGGWRMPVTARKLRGVYDARRGRCRRSHKLAGDDALHEWVRDKLEHLRWSPEQSAGRLLAMQPEDPAARVNPETRLRRDLRASQRRTEGGKVAALRQHKPSRGRVPRAWAPPWSWIR